MCVCVRKTFFTDFLLRFFEVSQRCGEVVGDDLVNYLSHLCEAHSKVSLSLSLFLSFFPSSTFSLSLLLEWRLYVFDNLSDFDSKGSGSAPIVGISSHQIERDLNIHL